MLTDCFETSPTVYKQSSEALAACGDALTLLKQFKSASVDLIFADPPYNLGKDYGNNSTSLPDQQYIA